ncbi:radical SAM protein [Candidatus Omnitrophota bacterium]
MKLTNKLKALTAISNVKLFRKRIPLVVTWPITNRCNFQCQYCGRWQGEAEEVSTEEALAIIDQLSNLGCLRISFSGGEPLLREDFGTLIAYCKKKSITTTVISNGSLIPQKIDQLKDVDLIELSLDGAREVNDAVRSNGSFDKILLAAAVAQGAGIKVFFNAVLTKYNLDHIDCILSIGRQYNTGVLFGPVSYIHSKGVSVKHLFPRKDEFRQAVDKLIHEKRNGAPVINSMASLKYMKGWPQPKRIQCYAGKAFCHITAEGRLYPCVAMEDRFKASYCKGKNFKLALKNLSKGNYCQGCWCTGTLEFNRLLAFKISALFTLWRLSEGPLGNKRKIMDR